MNGETILIVDDEPANLAVLNQILSTSYQVRAANSGARALQVAGTDPCPDLILLDIMMPEMGGYSVLSQLLEDPSTRDIPVIFITALEAIEDEKRGLEMGAADYITRPIRPAILLARIKAHLTLKQARDFLNDKNTYLEAEITRRMEENETIQTERNDIERQLNHAHKMAAVGQLAGGIAHEINTPTQYIGDNLRFLQECWGDYSAIIGRYQQLLEAARAIPALHQSIKQVENELSERDFTYLSEEIPSALQQAIGGTEQVVRIVRSMKDFAHPSGGSKKPTDINRIINNTITVCKNEWKYVAETIVESDPELPLVNCLGDELSQVILNIMVNAAHAIEVAKLSHMGQITVSTGICEGMVEIRISDTGGGVSKSIREDIFNPFFTTKEVGKGTGQGLAIAHNIVVDKHHGTLSLESEEGLGSTFIIRLPLGSGNGRKN